MTEPVVTGEPGADGVRLRPMRWWDLEDVLPLEARLFGATAWSGEAFWSELARPATRAYLVAETPEGLLAGYAGVMVVETEADVQTVAVAPAARRRGVGAALLEAVLAQAARRGARSAMLEVRADNAEALALYRRHGFEPLTVRRRYYQPGDVDAIVLRARPLTVAGADGAGPDRG